MSINPGYELSDQVVASTPTQLKALAHPLRSDVLDLTLERAATVTELAAALGRPKSTVAHHVEVLVQAGLLQVVRTRRVRAIDERFYGRTGRTILIERGGSDGSPRMRTLLAEAAAEAGPGDDVRDTLRHVRIPADRAAAFWRRVEALAEEFIGLERSGTVVHAFAAAVYPTDRPVLPPTEEEPPE
jgi:DNA-binding transcriptional ArsR family regulator